MIIYLLSFDDGFDHLVNEQLIMFKLPTYFIFYMCVG